MSRRVTRQDYIPLVLPEPEPEPDVVPVPEPVPDPLVPCEPERPL